MTYAEWSAYYRDIMDRAYRLRCRIVDQARREAEEGGLDGSMPFLTAHNCLCSKPGEGWAAQASHKTARRILFLERKSFEPERMAARIGERAWKKVSR